MKSPLLFLAALVAGISYMGSWALPIPDAAAIAWKGAGVGLLATWASRQGTTPDHKLLAIVLTLGAAADMVLEVNFTAGAAIFALGHVVAIVLYLRNRRPGTGWKDVLLGAAFVAGSVAFAYHLASADWAPAVAVYTLFLAAMAATALAARFPLAAAGALLFLISDLLIFARMGSLSGARWADFGVWATYFGGQALIAWGVARGIAAAKLDSGAARH
jgi:uncharacterized membrane protein YhhN